MNPDEDYIDFNKFFNYMSDTEAYIDDCKIVCEKAIFKNGQPDLEHRKYVRKLVAELKEQEDKIYYEEMNEAKKELARLAVDAFKEVRLPKASYLPDLDIDKERKKMYEDYIRSSYFNNP